MYKQDGKQRQNGKNRTTETRLPDGKTVAVDIGQLGQDHSDGTAGTGQSGRTVWTGQPGQVKLERRENFRFLRKFQIFAKLFAKVLTKTNIFVNIFVKMFGIPIFYRKTWTVEKTNIFVKRNFANFR